METTLHCSSDFNTADGEGEFIPSPSNTHDSCVNPTRTSVGANRPKPEIRRRHAA